MIDIHSHVLAGIDDGAPTTEDSLNMIRLAAASGTTDLVATPHANANFPFDEERIRNTFADLSSRTAGLLNLHLGCDFHLNVQNLQDALTNPIKFTINRGPYLLVELPEFIGVSAVRAQLRSLIDSRIRPIITHPERNVQLQSALDHLKVWVSDGCLVQITAQSLLGGFGERARRVASQLLKRDLVHFVASDAHDCISRTPDLSAAFRQVCDFWGEARAQALFIDQPAAVISGMPLALETKRRQPHSISLLRRIRLPYRTSRNN